MYLLLVLLLLLFIMSTHSTNIPSTNAVDNIEQHRSDANAIQSQGTPGAGSSSATPSVGQQVDEASSFDGQSTGISTRDDAMDVDQSPISSLLPSRNVPAGDVDFQGRIDRLKLSLDNTLAESGFISDSLLVEQDDQAREKAIIRLTQLDKAVQILSNMLERLMASVTATNHLATVHAVASPNDCQPSVATAVAPLVNPSIVPPNLPYFQWEGSAVFMPNKPIFVTIDACLLNFQDILDQFSLDLDKEYARLVPPMLSNPQRTWYQSFVASRGVAASWAEFKSAFKGRYGVSVIEERQRCASDLINITLKVDESVVDFIDRFNSLRRRSFDQLPPSFLLVERFLKAIPPVLKEKVNLIRQSKEIMESTDVDIVINITRQLLSSMTANEIGAIMVQTFVPTAAGSAASIWANVVPSSSSSRPSSSPSARVGSVAAGRIHKPESKGTKSCIYHRGSQHNHDTTECNKYLRKMMAEHKPSGSNANSVSVMNKPPQQQHALSLKDARSQDRCRKCGAHNFSAANGTHECNTAVRTGDAPTSQLHRFGMLRIHDDVPLGVASSSSLPSAAPSASDVNAGSGLVVDPRSTAIAAKYCAYHQVYTHDSAECNSIIRLRSKKLPRSSSAGVNVQGNESSRSALLSLLSSPAVSSPVAVGASVPVQSIQDQGKAGLGEPHFVPPVVPAAANQSHNQVDLPLVTEAMDIDLHTATQAHKCKHNEKSSLPVNKTNSLLIPLVVESHKVYGVLDTGCTFSICSPRFATQLGIKINYVEHGHVQLGHTESVQPRIGTCHLHISYNKRKFIHKFEIFDFFTDSDDCPMLLGLDIMPDLQIGVTGLTSTWYEETGPRLPDPVDPDIEPNQDPYGSPAERAVAFKPIEMLLKENAAIDLATTHCNLPGAIVQLETIPGKIAYRAPYPIPVVYKEAVSKQLLEWERDGVIERSPSHNGWNSPLLVVAKKNSDGEYSFAKPRIVSDVRLLNQILISTDKYIMPRIDEIHARHSRAVITSSVDIKSFFTSFLVDSKHRHKLAFTDPFTQIQWVHRKICFGVNFMGNLSMRLLSDLFSDMRDNVSLYIDDLGCLSYTDSLSEHAALVAEVIRRLTKANLQINQDKFVFAQRSTHVLGWSIIQNRLVPDARKLTNFHLWPIPTTGKQVMKYLGFCNYFRNVIPGFSELAAPLDALRNYKSLDGLWTDTHTKAFKALQAALSSPVALSPVDFRYKLHVATDASATAIGGIIYYIKDNVVHYVTMASRKLSPSEMAYSTTKRELLAIVYMFTKYHKWLFGIEFVLHTDHRSLIWLQTQSTPNMMLLTWYEKIFFDYKYEIVHIPGTRNVLPDALSRLFTSDDADDGDDKLGGGNRVNNKSIMVAEKKRKPTWNKNGAGLLPSKESQDTHGLHPPKHNKANRMLFKRKQKFNNNKQFQSSFVAPTKKVDPHYFSKQLADSEIDIFDARTYDMPSVSAQDIKNQEAASQQSSVSPSLGKVSVKSNNALISRALKFADYMTPPQKDRLELIMRVHLLGHVGINSIEKILHNDYKVHWTNMRDDIAKVTKDCHACQSHGIYQVGYHPPRSVLPDNVFDHVAIDLGDFSTTSTSGNNFILVIVDYFSRFTILRALPDKSPITVAKALLSVCCLFGFFKRLSSDNGSEFVSAFMREFSELCGMDRLTSLPYAAQANGVVEAYVGISKRAIIKSLTHDAAEPESWDEYLDVIQYSMNIQYARLHQSQPFSIMFGRAANLFQDYSQMPQSSKAPPNPTQEVIDERLKNIKEIVIPAIHKRIKETQLRDHERFEKNNKIVQDKYPINSKVMLLNVFKSSKLQPRWLGPYFIKNYTRNGSYVLADITGELLPRDVPTQHIRVVDYSDNHATKGLHPKHYEVQAIVKHRTDRKTGKVKFLVNWVGYPDPKDNTWQFESDFDSKGPIRDYWARLSTDHSNPHRPLPNTVNKRKTYSRRKHAGPSNNMRFPSTPNSREFNISHQQQQ